MQPNLWFKDELYISHTIINVVKDHMCMHAKSLQSCPTLCSHVNCSPPGFSVHDTLQARILEWVAMPSSRGSSQPRDWIQVSSFTGEFFTIWATREAHIVFHKSVFSRSPVSKSLGDVGLKYRFLCPVQDLLNLNIWAWVLRVWVFSKHFTLFSYQSMGTTTLRECLWVSVY